MYYLYHYNPYTENFKQTCLTTDMFSHFQKYKRITLYGGYNSKANGWTNGQYIIKAQNAYLHTANTTEYQQAMIACLTNNAHPFKPINNFDFSLYPEYFI